ncbi:serine acetyltransferase [Niabella ginsenosidivorans]|nr:serine acetyltransferase [Niabella ginsenosidivorans]
MDIFCDWSSNRSNSKGRLILLLFRIAHIATISKLFFVLWVPYLALYRIFVEWILCCELPYKTKIGRGLSLYHGQALVINDGTVIGDNCILRHSTTIGNKQLSSGTFSKCPVIGNNVDVGSNVCIFGAIIIGNNVKIGAGSVVVKDVPSNCIVAGNPARVIKFI